MGLASIDINFLAVFAAAVVGMVIGALWYSPLLFGKLWMQLSNITAKQIAVAKKQGMTKAYLLQFVALLVMAYALSLFMGYATVGTVVEAFQVAFWLWLGFQATLELGGVLWAGKSWSLFLLNAAHNLVVLAVISWVLLAMA